MTIDDVVARETIRDLIHRISRGADRADPALRRSVLTEDAVFHYGIFDGPAREYVQWLAQQSEQDGGAYAFDATHHLLGQTLITLNDHQATTETWFTAIHVMRDRESAPYFVAHGGRYFDRFVQQRSRWLMAERTMILDWEFSGRSDTTCPQFPSSEKYLRGQRDRSDPTYQPDYYCSPRLETP